jgi:peptidase S41-like protein
MSEKIYAWLLRLYPPHFRENYGDEALQLLRDRARDETGFFRSLRLWLDLLTDLAISIPREYRGVRRTLIGAAVQRVGGGPTFFVLEDGSIRLRGFVFGGILSLAVLAMVFGLLLHAGGQRTVRASTHRELTSSSLRSYASASATAQNAEDSIPESVAYGSTPPLVPLPQLDPLPAAVPQSEEQSPTVAGVQGASGAAPLDAAERQRVIDGVVTNLKRFYFDREVAQKTADSLLAHEKNGDDKAATGGEAFASLVTAQMRDASHDAHLELEYSQDSLPAAPPVETPDSLEGFRQRILQQNCMIRRAEILPHNVGYLKIDFFPDVSVCGASAKAAMAALNNADAIIFDLRDNTGGFENMVALIASYLFDHPEYLYSPRGAPTEESWTRSPVPGSRLANKPVYVLTSSATWSGAEQFSYDLKQLKRATLIGETTRGGAHAGAFHRIDDHFGMGIPEEKAINPFGKADWEGVGVEPDIKVKATDALETARKLAESKLHNN